MGITLDVDVGGTFTDCVLIREGEIITAKKPSTPDDLSRCFMEVLEAAGERAGPSLEDLLKGAEMVRYSTTLATNMLLERKGEVLGLITTAGNEDMMFIGRSRQWADGLPLSEQRALAKAKRPEPLIPPELTCGVRERVDYTGKVIMPLRKEDVIEKLKYLSERGAKTIVVCLLWSFLNPVHERMIAEVAREVYPDIPVMLSSEVYPKWHEYPRANVTILNAYLERGMRGQLQSLEEKLSGYGYKRPLLMINNGGGMGRIGTTRPVDTYNAGPVAGLLGSSYLGRLYGIDNIVTTDMGGTSFDIGTIVAGAVPYYVYRPVIDRWLTELSMLEVKVIGAGGGSIAWINELLGNKLEVGPQSAGAVPGPACYGLGGVEPTVTDADVVLGYLDPDYFLGGRMKLDKERAMRAIKEEVADKLGLTVEEAALAIKQVIDAKMGNEIFKETVLKGHDPKDFVLFAYGGAGPTHCCGYEAYLGVSRIMTFPFASVFCALGGATMDIMHLYERSKRLAIYDPATKSYLKDFDEFNQMVRDLQEIALKDMEAEGFAKERVSFVLELDMRYGTQAHLTRVMSPRLFLKDEQDVKAIFDSFGAEYVKRYSEISAYPEGGVEIENICLRAVVSIAKPELPTSKSKGPSPRKALKGKRDVCWDESGFRPTDIYEHKLLESGNVVEGPAVVESTDTTYLIPEGRRYRIDKYLNGIIDKP